MSMQQDTTTVMIRNVSTDLWKAFKAQANKEGKKLSFAFEQALRKAIK